jgi:hypothetical protein
LLGLLGSRLGLWGGLGVLLLRLLRLRPLLLGLLGSRLGLLGGLGALLLRLLGLRLLLLRLLGPLLWLLGGLGVLLLWRPALLGFRRPALAFLRLFTLRAQRANRRQD